MFSQTLKFFVCFDAIINRIALKLSLFNGLIPAYKNIVAFVSCILKVIYFQRAFLMFCEFIGFSMYGVMYSVNLMFFI